MLDAANILMNNYQIVAARTQPLNPSTFLPKPTTATTEATSTIPPANSADITSTSATATVSSANTASINDTKQEDLPSTSAAALQKTQTQVKAEVTTTTITTTEIPVAKHNQVTIEDLGGEDHIDLQPPTSTIDSTSEHMNELRKRRLKFLEERNKPSSTE